MLQVKLQSKDLPFAGSSLAIGAAQHIFTEGLCPPYICTKLLCEVPKLASQTEESERNQFLSPICLP